ncbi:hypothetical protein [Streptomyces caniscabiei]|uniref:hypothetical protein n=1 Tax=Streptomyces caniscabiei TaxID=2746961 RepID=UPI0018733708|nr:hypothetical protein [Streptomyces caniscabiei]MBE4791720.1 hypothetical protein [Streptomyces caniscabiei]
MTHDTGQPPDQTTPTDGQPSKICAHWIGAERRHCGAIEGVRPYLTGLCCPLHTPRALRGLPEFEPGPGWPADAWTTPSPLSASALFDERAVASGRRRSSAHVYQAARAAEERRKAGDR